MTKRLSNNLDLTDVQETTVKATITSQTEAQQDKRSAYKQQMSGLRDELSQLAAGSEAYIQKA
jgi:hypothetical protein